MAMPLEGGSNVYDDTDILDEISDYLTNACFYNNALLEPTNDLLCARQVSCCRADFIDAPH